MRNYEIGEIIPEIIFSPFAVINVIKNKREIIRLTLSPFLEFITIIAFQVRTIIVQSQSSPILSYHIFPRKHIVC